MKISELLNEFKYGEFSNIYANIDGTAGIPTDRIKEVVFNLKMGLTALYTRFPLKMSEVIIQSYDHISVYYLRKEYSHLNPDPEPKYKYIIDTPEFPFNAEVVKITQVVNELGRNLHINDEENWASVHICGYDSIQLTHPSNESAFAVVYQSDHPWFDIENPDLVNINIEIPSTYKEVLLLYTAARILGNKGTAEQLARSQLLMQRYESLCSNLELNSIGYVTRDTTNIKFHKNGWV